MSRTTTRRWSSSMRYRTRYSPLRARHMPSKGARTGTPTARGRCRSGPEMNSQAANAAAGGSLSVRARLAAGDRIRS
jgi:hypothetical protein